MSSVLESIGSMLGLNPTRARTSAEATAGAGVSGTAAVPPIPPSAFIPPPEPFMPGFSGGVGGSGVFQDPYWDAPCFDTPWPEVCNPNADITLPSPYDDPASYPTGVDYFWSKGATATGSAEVDMLLRDCDNFIAQKQREFKMQNRGNPMLPHVLDPNGANGPAGTGEHVNPEKEAGILNNSFLTGGIGAGLGALAALALGVTNPVGWGALLLGGLVAGIGTSWQLNKDTAHGGGGGH